jgi:hypothetical protein
MFVYALLNHPPETPHECQDATAFRHRRTPHQLVPVDGPITPAP